MCVCTYVCMNKDWGSKQWVSDRILKHLQQIQVISPIYTSNFVGYLQYPPVFGPTQTTYCFVGSVSHYIPMTNRSFTQFSP